MESGGRADHADMDPAQATGTMSQRVLQITMLRMALDNARNTTKEITDPIAKAAAAQPAMSAAQAIAGRLDVQA